MRGQMQRRVVGEESNLTISAVFVTGEHSRPYRWVVARNGSGEGQTRAYGYDGTAEIADSAVW